MQWAGSMLVVLLGLQVASACFLNSCPYRRYGRTLKCESCGVTQEGICVTDGKCCTAGKCFASAECTSLSVCPEAYCRFNGEVTGFCITKGYCCSSEMCQKSMMCL